MSSIVAIAALLLRSAYHFLEAKLQEIGTDIGLILASNLKYHFRFESAPRICPLSQISAKSVQK